MPRERTRVALPYLRAWRVKRLVSQDELAARTGLSKSTIVRLESEPEPNGERQTAILSTVGKLAKALEVTREDLVYRDPEPARATKPTGAA